MHFNKSSPDPSTSLLLEGDEGERGSIGCHGLGVPVAALPGRVLRRANKGGYAEPFYCGAMEITEVTFSKDHPEFSTNVSNMWLGFPGGR